MSRNKVIIWTYFCDACYTEEEVTSGDTVPGLPFGAWTQADADFVVRSYDWLLGRDGATYCPDHRRRVDR